MKVFKFGGASVKDAEAVKNISVLLSKQSTKETVMVVSAMAKTTNALEEVCKSFKNAGADLASKVASIKQMHLQIIHDLFAENNTDLINNMGNLTTLTTKGAENLEKSLESLKEKDLKISRLQDALTKKDSVTLALVTSLKGEVGINDPDININVEKGVIMISIADNFGNVWCFIFPKNPR
jgi:aspartokinase